MNWQVVSQPAIITTNQQCTCIQGIFHLSEMTTSPDGGSLRGSWAVDASFKAKTKSTQRVRTGLIFLNTYVDSSLYLHQCCYRTWSLSTSFTHFVNWRLHLIRLAVVISSSRGQDSYLFGRPCVSSFTAFLTIFVLLPLRLEARTGSGKINEFLNGDMMCRWNDMGEDLCYVRWYEEATWIEVSMLFV